jgi:hypothetical protein
MDILGGHLLYDQATRQLFADSFTPGKPEDHKTPGEDPGGKPSTL